MIAVDLPTAWWEWLCFAVALLALTVAAVAVLDAFRRKRP